MRLRLLVGRVVFAGWKSTLDAPMPHTDSVSNNWASAYLFTAKYTALLPALCCVKSFAVVLTD